MGKQLREENPRWKGGRRITSLRHRGDGGYVRLLMPDHPRAIEGYVREHVVIYEDAYGPVPDGMVIHHRNGIRHDNRLENLEMMTRAGHLRWHRARRKELICEQF